VVLAAALYEPNTSLLAIAAILLGIWYLALAGIAIGRWPSRPEPGPPTTDLRDESPAVANLLANRWLLSEDSLPATLLDLAARGYLSIEDRGDGQLVCRLRPWSTAHDHLRSYEKQVLEHLHGLERDGVVPAGALTTGPQEESKRWWKKFRGEVATDAKSMGLAREFWPPRLTLLFFLVGIPVYLILEAAFGFKDSEEVHMTPFASAVTYSLWAGVVVLAFLTSTARLRDTNDGRVAAAHWLGVRKSLETLPSFRDLPPSGVSTWERHLAYGAALGVAGRAVTTLPLGAESDRRAWTDYGGGWRQVRVKYPRFRPGWGTHPVLELAIGVFRTAFAVWLLWLAAKLGAFESSPFSQEELLVGLIVLIIGGGLVALGIWSFVGLVWAVMDLRGTNAIAGQVLRTRTQTGGMKFENGEDAYFVAVYPGSGDTVLAWRVRPKLYPYFAQGQVVKVDVTPKLGYVKGRVD
jgi:hypothetical protein